MHSWTRNLAIVFLGLLVVSHLEPGAVIATNSPHKRMRILHGDASANVPCLLAVPHPFTTGVAAALEISESQLSAGSSVQIHPLTFWEHYKWLIIIVLTLCLLEAALIDVLLRERRRRRMAQTKTGGTAALRTPGFRAIRHFRQPSSGERSKPGSSKPLAKWQVC